jgi:hypothetical protein
VMGEYQQSTTSCVQQELFVAAAGAQGAKSISLVSIQAHSAGLRYILVVPTPSQKLMAKTLQYYRRGCNSPAYIHAVQVWPWCTTLVMHVLFAGLSNVMWATVQPEHRSHTTAILPGTAATVMRAHLPAAAYHAKRLIGACIHKHRQASSECLRYIKAWHRHA